MIISAIDGAGRIANVQQQGGSFYAGDSTNSIQYAAHGAVRQMKLGNGLWEEERHNARLEPTKLGLGQILTGLGSDLDTTNSNRLLLEYLYAYGTQNNGNVHTQHIRVGATTLTQNYTYDALNRLQTAAEPGGWSYAYDNDRYGNVKRQGLPYLIDGNTNRLSLGSGYQYDAAGNLIVDSTQRTFGYDAENRQTSYIAGGGLNADYMYDGEGRRVKKVQGGVTTIFVYDANGRLAGQTLMQCRRLARGT